MLDDAQAREQGLQVMRPPAWSILHNWKPPHSSDFLGMDRYRTAFIKENQLWLQHVFVDLLDHETTAEYRSTLLKSFTKILGEVEPQYYSPYQLPPKIVNGEVIEREVLEGAQQATGFEFDADPPQQLAIAQIKERQFAFTETVSQELLRLWLQRARFLQWLQEASAYMKPHSYKKRGHCELCASRTDLQVAPIYTMQKLASIFREQRDHSPLFSLQLWNHFYKTFTPTCTVCARCHAYYYARNQDIPVDERRFMRMQQQGPLSESMSALERLQNSQYKPVGIDNFTMQVVRVWYEWAKRFTSGEAPEDWLPLYGFEGWTKKTNLQALAGADIENALKDEDETSVKSDSPSEKERRKKRKLIDDWSSDSGEEDPVKLETD
jgi:hypothetical protein